MECNRIYEQTDLKAHSLPHLLAILLSLNIMSMVTERILKNLNNASSKHI